MKKSYGKVHRYRTAFGHTAGFWVRRVGLLAAAGLLLFLLGWSSARRSSTRAPAPGTA